MTDAPHRRIALSCTAWPEGARIATAICTTVEHMALGTGGFSHQDLSFCVVEGRVQSRRAHRPFRPYVDTRGWHVGSAHGALRKAEIHLLLDRWVREGAALPGLACRGLAPAVYLDISFQEKDATLQGRWALMDQEGEPDPNWPHTQHPLLVHFHRDVLDDLRLVDAKTGSVWRAAQALLDLIDALCMHDAAPDSPWWIFCGHLANGVGPEAVRLLGKPIQARDAAAASALGPLLSYKATDVSLSPGADVLPFSHPHVAHMALCPPKPLVFDGPDG